jgi:hypothetical protein
MAEDNIIPLNAPKVSAPLIGVGSSSAPLFNNLHMRHTWSQQEDEPPKCLRCGAIYLNQDSCP